MYVAVAPAKGEPADALVVDDYSRIEGSFTLAESWSITVYHTFAQWVCPGPHGEVAVSIPTPEPLLE